MKENSIGRYIKSSEEVSSLWDFEYDPEEGEVLAYQGNSNVTLPCELTESLCPGYIEFISENGEFVSTRMGYYIQ